MEMRFTFNEFKNKLSNNFLSLENLSNYLEFDPESPVPKLRFRKDALLDEPADDFDIDQYIYEIQQAFDEDQFSTEKESGLFGKKKVVAEGDSWMNLPLLLGWKSIGDCLKSRNRYKVRNIGMWGHTIVEMVERKEYMSEIRKKKPDFFVFSGGGNDLQDKLAQGGIIKRFEAGLPPDDYLTDDGLDMMKNIEALYRVLLTEITTAFPDVKIFTHSYDYPRPLLGKGKYIGQYLRERGIPDDLMSPIVNHVPGFDSHRLTTIRIRIDINKIQNEPNLA